MQRPAGGAPISGGPSWADYVDFRLRAMRRLAALAGLDVVEDDGLVAVLSAEERSRGAMLVAGPVPEARLDAALARGLPGWVALLPEAAPLAPAVAARGFDAQEQRVAMALTDLRHLAPPPVPPGVTVQPVAVRQGAEGFSLDRAIRLAFTYAEETPAAVRDLEIEAQLIGQLTGIRFFAAVDGEGELLGTAGSRVVDGSALVASVATHPSARGRGIGTAMTGVALVAAAEAGATEAYLDATPAAVGIYRRLGFREIGPVCWCERSAL